MATIEKLIKGNGELVRAANICVATGRMNRPITRLVPLEVSSSDSELLPTDRSRYPRKEYGLWTE